MIHCPYPYFILFLSAAFTFTTPLTAYFFIDVTPQLSAYFLPLLRAVISTYWIDTVYILVFDSKPIVEYIFIIPVYPNICLSMK